MNRLIILILGLTLVAASCNQRSTAINDAPKIGGIESPVPDSAEPKAEPEAEAPKETKSQTAPQKQSFFAKVADLVTPKTEEEQDQQIDQNTMKNVEQDAKLDEHENEINELQNVVNNPPPSPTPTPTPEPTPPPPPTPAPPPAPTPVPEPIWNVEGGRVWYNNSIRVAFGSPNNNNLTLKSFKYQLFDGSLKEESVLVKFHTPNPTSYTDILPPDVPVLKEYVATESIQDMFLEVFSGPAVKFKLLEITYRLDGSDEDKTVTINSESF